MTTVAGGSAYVELTADAGEEAAEALTNFLWELGARRRRRGDDRPGAPPACAPSSRPTADTETLTARVDTYLDGLRALGLAAGPRARLAPVADADWAAAWREHFRPVAVGRALLVAPPWEIPAASDRVVLAIEPGRAFGTGHHGTTAGCLELLEALVAGAPPPRALDLGTGSGILAVAAARLGVGDVLACDTDPDAVEAARANAARNGVEGRVRAVDADAATLAAAPAPLVLANLLAAAHHALAARYRELVADGRRPRAGRAARRRGRGGDRDARRPRLPSRGQPQPRGLDQPDSCAMRRFTLPPERLAGGRVTFDAGESRHLARVLRLRPGDTVIATDGAGRDYTVRLESVGEPATGTVIAEAAGVAASPLAVTLIQGVPKGDKMEAIVRAATELGVARVRPALCERTIVRLEASRWRERARRWQRVAREAAKQCGRAVIPEVETPRPLAEWLALDEPADLALCLWEGGGTPLATLLAAAVAPRSALLVIGPEGGLAAAEVDAARAHGLTVASLGPRILRTETAGPALVAIVQSRFGDLG